MLEIKKNFQETIEVVTKLRFCYNVNGHEITGILTATAGYYASMYGLDVQFDDLYGKSISECGLFTPEQVDEIEFIIIEEANLPIVEE